MKNNDIWLEVDKSNGAILSYFLAQPTSPSNKVDYIRATQAELLYLNCLEDYVLPPGMVVTLSDLEKHRERVREVNKAKVIAISTPPKPLQTPEKGASKPSATAPSTKQNKAKESLIRAVRKRHGSK